MSTGDEFPTDLHLTLALGGTLPDTSLDLCTVTPPGATGDMTQRVNGTFDRSGTFLVTLTLSNQVSHVNLTKQVSGFTLMKLMPTLSMLCRGGVTGVTGRGGVTGAYCNVQNC